MLAFWKDLCRYPKFVRVVQRVHVLAGLYPCNGVDKQSSPSDRYTIIQTRIGSAYSAPLTCQNNALPTLTVPHKHNYLNAYKCILNIDVRIHGGIGQVSNNFLRTCFPIVAWFKYTVRTIMSQRHMAKSRQEGLHIFVQY